MAIYAGTQLTAKETLFHGAKRFGEIEVDHVNILLDVDERCHLIFQHKKVSEAGPFGKEPILRCVYLERLQKLAFKEPFKNLTDRRSKPRGSIVGCTLLGSIFKNRGDYRRLWKGDILKIRHDNDGTMK